MRLSFVFFFVLLIASQFSLAADDWASIDSVTMKAPSISKESLKDVQSRFSFGVGSSVAPRFEGRYGNADFGRSPSFILEYSRTAINSLGFSIGFQYDTPASLEANYSSSSRMADKMYNKKLAPKLQTTVLSGSAVYKMTHFYIPFGMNYTLANYDNNKWDGDFSTSGGKSGGIGFQLGAGYEFDNAISVEFMVRSLGLALSERSSAYTQNYGSGYLYSGNIGLKFFF